MKVWHDARANAHYVKKIEVSTCHFCKDDIEHTALYYMGWNKKEKDEFIFCPQCVPVFGIKTPTRNFWECRIVLIKETIPPHCTLITNQNRELKDAKGDYSVYEGDKVKAEKTIDKTKYAGQHALEGSTIGAPPSIMERQMHSMKQLGEEINKNLKAVFYNEDGDEVKENERKRISEK